MSLRRAAPAPKSRSLEEVLAIGANGARFASPMPLGAPATLSDFKPNSGSYEEWSAIVEPGGLTVLNAPPMPEDTDEVPRRAALVEQLKADLLNEGDPFTLEAVGNNLVSSDSAVKGSGPVWTIKLWGFAGLAGWRDPTDQYRNATMKLLEVLRPQLRAILPGDKPYLVLHFDGDPAAEKTDDKFTHAMFAPYVARLLSKELQLPIHLVITKVDTMKGPDIRELFTKFADQVSSDSWKIRTAASVPPMHFYPYFDRSSFASCAIACKPTTNTKGSEVQNAILMDEVFYNRVQKKFCICVGGNTESGVGALSQWMQSGNYPRISKFDAVVRVNAWGLKP